ncbi:MAG: type IIA DNA topoisomerase subunit B [Cyclobacteriaceae bacterium]|nr:type IIA DNA topoisomerase subunit B [Cyclobacteriaceae bacterium]
MAKPDKTDKASNLFEYTEASIRSLDWREHIRLRPGMYIGKLGDGTSKDDGIYVLVKEVVDNSIDEHMMGHGKTIDITITDQKVVVRDYGRGIPLGKVVDVVSKINTGAKYDSGAFQKSVGLNGVGTKAVNALSNYFKVQAFRDGQSKLAEFKKGILVNDPKVGKSNERNGTLVEFEPDNTMFKNYHFIPDYLEDLMWNYAFLNAGLTINYNGKKFYSKDGLLDLLKQKTEPEEIRYPIVHVKGNDIEFALTHGNQYGEEYYSFVNGQNTTQGGTHLAAFREGLIKGVRDFYKKDFDASDIRSSIIAAIAVRVQEPVFESQTKTKLGSVNMAPDGPSVRNYVGDFVAKEVEIYLHKNPTVADALQKRILQSERERKEIAGIKKLANERAKKANLHNKKLRDCRFHFDEKDERGFNSMIFITEGDSASGSITKSRNVETQAVFSLRGKPLNCYGLTKKVVYENEEFNLLQHALNIEDGLDGLRYNRVIIATDADVDGMHIRLLLMTFFLQFFPDLVKAGHVYILETPLFRVRNKKETIYCYSEEEKQEAMQFIGDNIRLQPVTLDKDSHLKDVLEFYMGKNTPDRQDFIIDNLRIELDKVEREEEVITVEAE